MSSLTALIAVTCAPSPILRWLLIPTLAPSATLSPIVRLAREPDLSREQTMPADGHIVADLDLVVDFGAFPDHGVAQTTAIDGRSGADFHVVLKQDAAGLRHLQVAVGPEKTKP